MAEKLAVDDRPEKRTAIELLVREIRDRALRGNMKAAALLRDLLKDVGLSHPEPIEDAPPRPEDFIIVSWDTAMSGKELSDFSASVVLYVQGENIYIVDVIRERLEFPALKRRVIEQYQRYRNWRNRCDLVIEDKGSGMSLIQQLRSEGIYPRAFSPEGTDKVLRMASQCARLEAGLFIPRRAAWLPDFKPEILAFPVGRYDDQVDALSQALIYLEQRRRSRIRFGVVKGQI